MSLRSALLIPVLAAPLAAQTFITLQREETKAPAGLQDWLLRLKEDTWARWVLLPGTGRDGSREVETLLDSDPDLLEIGLKHDRFNPEQGVARELRAREGWGPEGRWVLVDPDGSVLDTALSPPDSGTLKATLERHGVQGRLQRLTAFLGRNPDRVDAETALLDAHAELATALMKPYLKPAPASPDSDEESPAPRELAKPLSDEDDQRIWGRLAARGEAFLLRGDWRWEWQSWCSTALAGGAARSSTMRAMAIHALPALEAALQRAPGDYQTWGLWVNLQEVAGGRPIRPLLDSLTALPLPRRSVMPDEYSLGAYIQGAKRQSRWTDIVGLVQPWFDQERARHWKLTAFGADGKPTDALKGTWIRLLGPLVEAYLRLGRFADADRVVRQVAAWRPSPDLPQWASTVARRCGEDLTASQWAALPVPKPAAP